MSGGGGDPARQERLRALNLELVFRRLLAASDPVSRTELAAATGLTRPTITRIVEELIAGRLVTETGTTPAGRAGRPRMGLRLSRSGPAGLGLDIRTDGLAACVVDLTGTVRHLAFAPLDDPEAPAVLDRLGRMAVEAVEAATAEGLTVVTATLAVPGPTDGGIVRTAPALGWRSVDAGALLRERIGGLGLVCAVDNEANLAARGERHAAASGAPDDFVYVSGGLDIGAGIVLGGRPMRGSHGWGGELGHVTVDPDGKPCRCGARGCLQTYASLAAILGGEGVEAGTTPDAAVLAWADEGRPQTLAALDTAAHALGVALANVLNLFDIDTVLLGGSFAVLSSWLLAGVETELRQRVLSAAWAPIAVHPATLGPDAAAIGAAATVVDHIAADPAAWLAAQR
ncbi:ROK family transcriptional regulator [Glycomyces paridis]|uniref:ROK family transcriptional regulator n=1 Tax=Glycomyces paridis TaxID=2126555 RepID=A0A4V4HM95_9ACTN|nr:ROK family transcriptional regulator [Glycomyces paridis]THV21246.1 ROK family transcriptional regulator [Glycomyces paridis]